MADGGLIALLKREDRQRLLALCEPVTFRFADVVVRQGEAAADMFVLVHGPARVVREEPDGDETTLAHLGPGDVVGEVALLEGGVRSATVRASGELSALRLTRARFDEMLDGTGGGELRSWLEQVARARSVQTLLATSAALRGVSPHAMRALGAELSPREVPAREVVFRAGDEAGPMYFVRQGKLRVVDEAGAEIGYLRAGDAFGEGALLTNKPRTATVEAVSDVELFELRPDAFERVARAHADLRRGLERYRTDEKSGVGRVPLDFALELLPQAAPAAVPVEASPGDSVRDLGAPEEDGPELHPEGRVAPPLPFRLFGFPFVYQLDESDCGVACLAMICRYFGRSVALTRIRRLAHTSTDGTSLANLARAARALGLATTAMRVSKENVARIPTPAILHWDKNHWVVLLGIRGDHAAIADPAAGQQRVSLEELREKWSGYTAMLAPAPSFTRAPEDKRSTAWLAPLFRPHRGSLVHAFGWLAVASASTMALPSLTQLLVDRAIGQHSYDWMTIAVWAMLATFAMHVLATVLHGLLLARVAVVLDVDAFDFLTARLFSLPTSYFRTRRTGDLQRRLDGARHIRMLAVQGIIGGLFALLQITIAVSVMAIYAPGLSLLFLGALPLYGLLMFASAKWLRPLFDKLEEAYGKYASVQIDAIRGIETVKASAAETPVRERLRDRLAANQRQQFRADFAELVYHGAVGAVGFVISLSFVWIGAQKAMSGELTVGGMFATTTLAAMATGPLQSLLGIWDKWQIGQVLLRRLDDVLDETPEQGKARTPLRAVPSLAGRVELRNLTFRYGGPDTAPVIRDIDLRVEPGTTVAVVGRSGSGKTTLVKLIATLLSPSEGEIIFDGVDIATLDVRSLRRRIGIVLQETYLFSGTILENITFGEDVDLERARRAASAACAHDFIERLPLGYDTPCGESGLTLSGGQKQRIAIARALYKDPDILVLDEATSALDTESERALKGALASILRNRTVFIVAHRLSTVRDADRIIVFERGEVVEDGTHDDLFERRGIYHHLVAHQLGS